MDIIELIIKSLFAAVPGMAKPAEISKEILLQLKKVLHSIIVLLIFSIILCILMGYLIDRTLTQLDTGLFEISNSIIFLLVTISINIIMIIWLLIKGTSGDKRSTNKIPAEARRSESPVETAIAALILSFIKEREATREENREEARDDAKTEKPSTE